MRPWSQQPVESVWDYPRPPRVEPTAERVVVEFGGAVLVDTTSALRVLETSHPPVYYVPLDRVRTDALAVARESSYCEFKGVARYVDVVVGPRRAERGAWHYPRPSEGYEALAGYIAFYPGRVNRATVDGEVVTPQDGGFYGGWVTSRVVGPFKGPPGTLHW